MVPSENVLRRNIYLMIETHLEIELIEEHYHNARYDKAYETLCQLCKNEACSEFYDKASTVLSRYNNLQDEIIEGYLDLTQQEQRKREIGAAYIVLIVKIKKRFDINNGFSNYEEQAIRMKENQNLLRKTLLEVEEDYDDCQCEHKSKILEKILDDIRATIKYFRELIKNFKLIQTV